MDDFSEQSTINPNFVQQIQKKASLVDIAYDAIREAIVSGRIRPGERLLQIDMAQKLGVSERTVREAFTRMVAKGLAVHEPHKGVRVIALPVEEIIEIYALRGLLEGHAMELAAERISDEDLAEMERLLPKTSAGENEVELKAAQEANKAFHWIAIRASGSGILVKILEELWELMFTYDLLYKETQEIRQQRIVNDRSQHSALLEALKKHDGEMAKQANTLHIQITLEKLMPRLK